MCMDGFRIRGIYEEEIVGMNSIGNGKKENGNRQVHLKKLFHVLLFYFKTNYQSLRNSNIYF